MSVEAQRSVESWLPLKPVLLHVLLALAERPCHAYGIIQRVRERSEDRIRLETGPLYRHLRKLLDGGLVVEWDKRPPDDDPRRGAYYALSPLGREVISIESLRLEGLVSLARQLGFTPNRRGG